MDFVAAFSAVFGGLVVLYHPYGNWAIFLALTSHMTPEEQKRTADKTTVAVLIISLIALLAGASVLSFFGLTIPSLQVTGGIILGSLGYGMILGGDDHADSPSDKKPSKDPSIVPMAIPLTSGSGVIIAMISFANNQLDPGFTSGHLGAILGIVLAVAVNALFLRAAPWLGRKLSPSTIDVMNRLTGIVVLGLGVLIGSAGLLEIFPGLAG